MAIGVDALIEHLLAEIALCGSRGATSADFHRYVQKFYDQINYDQDDEHVRRDLPSTVAPSDRKFLEIVWSWLVNGPDVLILHNNEPARYSLAEFESLELPEEEDGEHTISQPESTVRLPITTASTAFNKTPTASSPASVPLFQKTDLTEKLQQSIRNDARLLKAVVVKDAQSSSALFHPASNAATDTLQTTKPPTFVDPLFGKRLSAAIARDPRLPNGMNQKGSKFPAIETQEHRPSTPQNHHSSIAITTPTPAHNTGQPARAKPTPKARSSSRPQKDAGKDAGDGKHQDYLGPKLTGFIRGYRKRGSKGALVTTPIFPEPGVSTKSPRLFTSQERTWQAVAGHSVDYKKLSHMEFVLLSIIASRGAEGILQPELRRLSGQDKRSVPKRTDDLAKKGYIEKKSVNAHKTRTSILLHKKFVRESAFSTTSKDSTGVEGVMVNGAMVLPNLIAFLHNLLKDMRLVTLLDLRQKLGITPKQWNTKAVSRAIRRLEDTGFITRTKAKKEGTNTWLLCIKLLRDPNEEDFKILDFKRKGLGNEPGQTLRPLEEEMDGEDVMRELELEVGHDDSAAGSPVAAASPENDDDIAKADEGGAPSGIVTQWDPSRQLIHLIHEAVKLEGARGSNSRLLRAYTMGQFWRRPLEALVCRLTDNWELSQPNHLRHLAIIRDTAVTKEMKFVHYVYRTYENFQKAVDEGEATWEAVRKETANKPANRRGRPKKVTAGGEDGPGPMPGFAPLSANQFLAPAGTSTLKEARRSIRVVQYAESWDKNLLQRLGMQKVYKAPAPRMSYSTGRPRGRPKSFNDNSGSLLENATPDGPKKIGPKTVYKRRTIDQNPRSSNAKALAQRKTVLVSMEERAKLGLPIKGRLKRDVEVQIKRHLAKNDTIEGLVLKQSISSKPIIPSKRTVSTFPPNEQIDASTSKRPCLSANVGVADRSMGIGDAIDGSGDASTGRSSSVPVQKRISHDGWEGEPTTKRQRLSGNFQSTGLGEPVSEHRDGKIVSHLTELDQPRNSRAVSVPMTTSLQTDYGMSPAEPQVDESNGFSTVQPIPEGTETSVVPSIEGHPKALVPINDAPSKLYRANTIEPIPISKYHRSIHNYVRETEAKYYNRNAPGFYVNPYVTRRVPIGRPRKAYMGVVKTKRLFELPWFEAEAAPPRPVHLKHPRAPKVAIQPRPPAGRPRQAPQGPTDETLLKHKRSYRKIRMTDTSDTSQVDVSAAPGHLEEIEEVAEPSQVEQTSSDGQRFGAVLNDRSKQPVSTNDRAPDDPATAEDALSPRPHDPPYISPYANTDPKAVATDEVATVSSSATSPAADDEGASRPSDITVVNGRPAKKYEPLTKRGVVLGKGSYYIQRTECVMEVFNLCNGILPGNGEIAVPFWALWAQKAPKNANPPDRGTLNKTIKQLVDGGRLKNLAFTFHTTYGVAITKHILTFPDIDPQSAEVKALQPKIIAAHPDKYYPEQIRHLVEQTQPAGKPKEVTKELEMQVQPLFPVDARLNARVAASTKARNRGNKELRIRKGILQRTGRLESLNTRMSQGPPYYGSDSGEDDDEPEHRNIRFQAEHPWQYHGDSDSEGDIEATDATTTATSGRSVWIHCAPFTFDKNYEWYQTGSLLQPGVRFHPSTGTFSTDFTVTRNARTELWSDLNTTVPPKALELVRSQGLGKDPFETIRFAHERLFLALPEHYRFYKDVNNIVFWESQFLCRNDEYARRWKPDDPFINLTFAGNQVTAPQPKGPLTWERWIMADSLVDKRFTVHPDGTLTSVKPARRRPGPKPKPKEVTFVEDENGQLVPSPEKEKRRRASGKNSIRVFQPIEPMSAEEAAQRVQERLERSRVQQLQERRRLNPTITERLTGLTGDPQPRRNRGPRTQNKPRAPQQPAVKRKEPPAAKFELELDEFKTLLYTLVIAAAMEKSIGGTGINMGIVRKVYHDKPEFNAAKTDRIWLAMKRDMSPQIHGLMNEFEDKFVEAYEKGDVPSGLMENMSDLADYDWPQVIKWAMSNCTMPKTTLPVNKHFMHDWKIIEDDYKPINREDWYKVGVPAYLREQRQFHYPYAIDLHEKPKRQDPEEESAVRARSWIRSNCATPMRVYNGEAAHNKFLQLGENVVSKELNNFIDRKILRPVKGTRVLPGRNFDFTLSSAHDYRRTLDYEDFLDAVAFKKELDEVFQNPKPELRALRYLPNARDGATMALSMLVAYGRVTIIPMLPPVNNTFGAPFPRLSVWGFIENDYRTRYLDRRRLEWPIIVVPTKDYKFGNGLAEHYAPGAAPSWHSLPDPPLPDSSDPMAMIPVWVAIDGKTIIWSWWYRILCVVIQAIIFIPGTNVSDIQRASNKSIEIFEIEMVVKWLEDVGAIGRTRGGGIMALENFYAIFGEELRDGGDDWFGEVVRRKPVPWGQGWRYQREGYAVGNMGNMGKRKDVMGLVRDVGGCGNDGAVEPMDVD